MNPGASTVSMCRARHRGAGSLSLPEACEVAHSRHRNLSPSFLHRSPLEAPTPHVRSRARSLMTGQFQSSPCPGRIARSPFGVPPAHIEAERSSDFRTPPRKYSPPAPFSLSKNTLLLAIWRTLWRFRFTVFWRRGTESIPAAALIPALKRQGFPAAGSIKSRFVCS